jgi:hypothetical protein
VSVAFSPSHSRAPLFLPKFEFFKRGRSEKTFLDPTQGGWAGDREEEEKGKDREEEEKGKDDEWDQKKLVRLRAKFKAFFSGPRVSCDVIDVGHAKPPGGGSGGGGGSGSGSDGGASARWGSMGAKLTAGTVNKHDVKVVAAAIAEQLLPYANAVQASLGAARTVMAAGSIRSPGLTTATLVTAGIQVAGRGAQLHAAWERTMGDKAGSTFAVTRNAYGLLPHMMAYLPDEEGNSAESWAPSKAGQEARDRAAARAARVAQSGGGSLDQILS